MPHLSMTAVTALALAASAVAGGPAAAAQDQGPDGRPIAEVAALPTARLVDDGAAVAARIRVTCVPDGTDGVLWEGFARVTQESTVGWVELTLRCDGRPHVLDVVVPALGDPEGTPAFTRADASLTVWLLDENTLVEHASDTRTVKVR